KLFGRSARALADDLDLDGTGHLLDDGSGPDRLSGPLWVWNWLGCLTTSPWWSLAGTCSSKPAPTRRLQVELGRFRPCDGRGPRRTRIEPAWSPGSRFTARIGSSSPRPCINSSSKVGRSF